MTHFSMLADFSVYGQKPRIIYRLLSVRHFYHQSQAMEKYQIKENPGGLKSFARRLFLPFAHNAFRECTPILPPKAVYASNLFRRDKNLQHTVPNAGTGSHCLQT